MRDIGHVVIHALLFSILELRWYALRIISLLGLLEVLLLHGGREDEIEVVDPTSVHCRGRRWNIFICILLHTGLVVIG